MMTNTKIIVTKVKNVNTKIKSQYRDQNEFNDPEQHPERYYNGRDYRREQELQEENQNT